VDERQQRQIEGPASAEQKEEWVRPQVDQLQAGGAEAKDGADADGGVFS
jgi:hypothetical protein